MKCEKCGTKMSWIRVSYKTLRPAKTCWYCNNCKHEDDGDFKGCGKIVWGDEELGTLNCGDPAGEWEIDNTDGTRKWVYTGFFKCKKCSQLSGSEKQ